MRKSWKWILISVHIRLIGGFNAHEQCARQRGASSQIWKKITNIPNMSTPATPEHNFSAVFPNNNWIMFCFTYPLVIKHGNGKQHLWFPIRTSNSRACSIEFPLIFHWFSIDFPLIFHWFSIVTFDFHWFSIDFPRSVHIFQCFCDFPPRRSERWKNRGGRANFFCRGPRAAPATDGFARAWPGELRIHPTTKQC